MNREQVNTNEHESEAMITITTLSEAPSVLPRILPAVLTKKGKVSSAGKMHGSTFLTDRPGSVRGSGPNTAGTRELNTQRLSPFPAAARKGLRAVRRCGISRVFSFVSIRVHSWLFPANLQNHDNPRVLNLPNLTRTSGTP
jgi:hypothetical protein